MIHNSLINHSFHFSFSQLKLRLFWNISLLTPVNHGFLFHSGCCNSLLLRKTVTWFPFTLKINVQQVCLKKQYLYCIVQSQFIRHHFWHCFIEPIAGPACVMENIFQNFLRIFKPTIPDITFELLTTSLLRSS